MNTVWTEPSPVLLFKDITLPDFNMVNFTVMSNPKRYAAGDWDELSVSFTFKRRYGWYIFQVRLTKFVSFNKSFIYLSGFLSPILYPRLRCKIPTLGYIPQYTTVFISWIPFYLGPKAIPARTMIGVNAVLAISFQFGNIGKNLPRVKTHFHHSATLSLETLNK